MIKYLSLFSGIGAFEKALTNQGFPFELVAFSEIDKYAVKSYCAIHGVDESLNLGDITKIDEKQLPKVDLITYGFPCQDISTAGKQQGLFNDDGTLTRSGLFFDALRIIEHCQPVVAIAENVKNLTSKKFSEQFDIVLSSLEKAGYNNYWKVLNAKDFGIPQNRERVFIISIRKDVDTGAFEFPEPYPLELRLKDMLEDAVDEKFFMQDDKIQPLIKNLEIKSAEPFNAESDGTCRTIKHQYFKNSQANFIRTGDQGATAVIEPIRLGNIYGEHCGTGYAGNVWDKDAISPTLMTMQGGNRQPMVIDKEASLRIRKLTPKECFRLMGFDDEDFEKAAEVNSNTQLYKQAGNSIVVDVAEELLCMMLDDEGNFYV